jgi:hypothetical protein
MSLLDDIKAKADLNGDGKVSVEDLEALKDGVNNDKLEQLKKIADQNGDDKIDVEDIKNINLDDIVAKAKDTFGNLFGGK